MLAYYYHLPNISDGLYKTTLDQITILKIKKCITMLFHSFMLLFAACDVVIS